MWITLKWNIDCLKPDVINFATIQYFARIFVIQSLHGEINFLFKIIARSCIIGLDKYD